MPGGGRLPLVLLAALSAASCTTDGDVFCAPQIPAAVAVVVRDSLTDSLVVDSATGTVIGNGRVDSLMRGPVLQFGDSALIGGTQVGLVVVQVEHPGYQPWVATGVRTRLSGGECPHLITAVLTARMQK